MEEDNKKTVKAEKVKKTYKRPELNRIGSVSELTTGGTMGAGETVQTANSPLKMV